LRSQQAVVRAVIVDADGQVHFTVLAGSPERRTVTSSAVP
jgi:hypothetical protein